MPRRLTDRNTSPNSLSISHTNSPIQPTSSPTPPAIVLFFEKKPAGALLSKTAHQIEREYTILSAIHKHNILPTTAPERRVPVPEPYVLCEDEGVIGTPFYVMEFLDGRIFTDVRMEEVGPQDRREWCVKMFLFVLDTFIRSASYVHYLLSMRTSDHQGFLFVLFTFSVAWSNSRHIFATQRCDTACRCWSFKRAFGTLKRPDCPLLNQFVPIHKYFRAVESHWVAIGITPNMTRWALSHCI